MQERERDYWQTQLNGMKGIISANGKLILELFDEIDVKDNLINEVSTILYSDKPLSDKIAILQALVKPVE